MPNLLLKRGGLLENVAMVFPEGELSGTVSTSMKIVSKFAGHAHLVAHLIPHGIKAVSSMSKSFFGGLWMPGTIYIYDDGFRFECSLHRRVLHSNVGTVIVSYKQTTGIRIKRAALIYHIIDIDLEEGKCRIVCTGGGQKIYDTIKSCIKT